MEKQTLCKWHCFEVVEEPHQLPDQRQVQVTTLQHPGAVVILAINPQGKIIMERQYRTAIKDWLVELPAGTIEANEQSSQGILECAKRELQEEVNLVAEEWHNLGKLYPAPGFCDEIQYLFVAKGLSAKAGQCDEDEFIEVFEMSLAEFEHGIVNGTINDAKTIACYSRAKLSGLLS
ncbi:MULTISPECIES: NUDIX hydrolase [unclassified Agarivorans]|uniref:NUDIX hydrolase n=1 Tax=unclassified Agarivorans TaxID=2636026 RepID=UPI0026E2A50A|nr:MULTISPECIES: NUDIX hydrolase [unclassified Agarivorans]MDO6688014.1 NUDIX hydrolase [Agarivorans sp. 3_MG-2023]MDO6715281.1 NUDIX hydrolase [Agarivorans sp. 2_MG-2023]